MRASASLPVAVVLAFTGYSAGYSGFDGEPGAIGVEEALSKVSHVDREAL